MSTHSLPEDMRDWPDDPYELLGLDEECDLRTAKRAYTRLIRKFKPEQAPDHFRKIRDAYETVQRYLQWHSVAYEPEEITTTSEVESDTPAGGETSDQHSEPYEPGSSYQPPSRSRDNSPSELSTAWRLAVDGSLQQSYEKLLSISRREGPQQDLLLRQYWLLRLEPRLDESRHRLEPLAEALSVARLSGPAAELYRREILDHPDLATESRFNDLLSEDADPTAMAELLMVRWQAACRIGWTSQVDEDIARFRPMISSESDELWARVLLSAMDQLAWQRDQESSQRFRQYQQEIDKLEHVHFNMSYELDRLDFLGVIAKGWERLARGRRSNLLINDLICDSWSQPFAYWHDDCRKLIQSLAKHPQEGMKDFDEVGRIELTLMVQVQNALETYQAYTGRYGYHEDSDSDFRKKQAARFIQSLDWTTARTKRSEILTYCLKNAFSPMELVSLVADPDDFPELQQQYEILEFLQSDISMQCVCLAWQTYWA